MLTKDRIAPTVAVVAAIIGLVLVFSGPQSEADDDDASVPPLSTSQVAPDPGGPLPAPVQGQTLPAPQDDDGNDDDG